MVEKRSVFLLGSGFIGLEILKELLAEGYDVTTIVRREDARARLEKMGSKTILGSLDDDHLVQDAASAADIIIHTATADHKPSAMSILDGIAKSGKTGQIYIHTSGCSALTDANDDGSHSEKIYEDDKPETVDSIADDAPHRLIDLAILNKYRSELGAKAKLSIVLPPVIYGSNNANLLSIQVPTMTRFAIKHGFAGYAGKGKAVWGHVHVSDLARGYLTILHFMESASGEKVLENPYFFIENGHEHSWEECAVEVGKGLKLAGRLEDPIPREIPSSLYGDLFQEWSVAVIGRNARNRANRLRALGWEAREKSTFDSLVSDEIPILLAEKGEFQGYGKAVAS
jgi:nucleoside-diphosphate-sugar epimerase